MRFLAINFGGIGDEILFLPTLEAIRNAHPDWHITLLVEPRSRSIEQVTDLVDQVVTFDIKKRPLLSGDLIDLLGILRDGQFDCVLSSGSSPLVSCLLFLSGIRARIGYGTNVLSSLLLTRAVPLNRNQYAADMYHDLVKGLDLSGHAVLPRATLRKESVSAVQKWFKKNGGRGGSNLKRVVIHPGSSLMALRKGIIKTWPAQSWAELMYRLSQHPELQVVLAGGPDDADTIKEINERLASMEEKHRILSVYGETKSLADFAATLSLSDLLVCIDSAPMHLAVGLGLPVVSMFGPTDPKKLLPEDPRFVALKSQVTTDQNGKFSSLKSAPGVQLPPDIVYQAVLDQLGQTKSQERSLESAR